MKRFLRIIGGTVLFCLAFKLVVMGMSHVGPLVAAFCIYEIGRNLVAAFLSMVIMLTVAISILLCCLAICWEVAFGE